LYNLLVPSAFYTTLYSFYDHNWPLIFFGGMSFLCLLLSLRHSGKFYLLLFIGFLILTFNFEYDKHLFSKIKTDMLDLVFPPSERFRKYNFVRNFLEFLLPVFMSFSGWGIIAFALIFKNKGRPKTPS